MKKNLVLNLLLAAIVLMAALLLWLWRTDYLLVRDCDQAKGVWDADARVCRIEANAYRASPVSRRR